MLCPRVHQVPCWNVPFRNLLKHCSSPPCCPSCPAGRWPGHSARCLVGWVLVLLTDSHLGRVQNSGWPSLTEFKKITGYKLFGRLPTPPSPTLTDSHLDRVQNIGWSWLVEFRILGGPARQSSEYWMAQLDRVQNIGWSSLAEFRILDGPAWQSSEYWMFQLGRDIGWPSLTEFKICTGYKLLEQEAVQLVAWSAAYPT